ncbi:MAG: hypothetical protein FWC74_10335, partial [Candidatus Bathyarchaeota archaeon]|nr:hypothetical protein [Candidatus Termitimicrobium sp.]
MNPTTKNQTNKKLTLTLLSLSLLFNLVAMPAVCAQQAPVAEEIYVFRCPTFDMYTPTRVIITYQSSADYSLTVTNYAQTEHHEYRTSGVSGYDSISFNTSSTDVYNLTFTARYAVWVRQTVTIELIEENNGRTKTISIDMNSQGFNLNMIINTITPPRYPSQEEIISGLLAGINTLFGNQFNQLQSGNRDLVSSILGSQILSSSALIIVLILSVIMFILQLKWHRSEASQLRP